MLTIWLKRWAQLSSTFMQKIAKILSRFRDGIMERWWDRGNHGKKFLLWFTITIHGILVISKKKALQIAIFRLSNQFSKCENFEMLLKIPLIFTFTKHNTKVTFCRKSTKSSLNGTFSFNDLLSSRCNSFKNAFLS